MTTCERCGTREATFQQCPGDHAHHRHGAVHTRFDGLQHVCAICILDVHAEWQSRRPANDPSDPRGPA